jgi:hypothetical protein
MLAVINPGPAPRLPGPPPSPPRVVSECGAAYRRFNGRRLP